MNEQQGLDPMFQENGSQWMEGTSAEPLNVYTTKTFGWMFLGLLVTFGTAIAFSAGGGLYYLLTLGMPAVFALCHCRTCTRDGTVCPFGENEYRGGAGIVFRLCDSQWRYLFCGFLRI